MSDWVEIVERYGGEVWGSAYRLLGSRKEAAECFGETFVSAWEVLENRRVQNLSVLLVRVVTAKSLERLRRRFHHGGRSDAVDLIYVPSDEREGGEQIQTRELVGQLQKALCRLGRQEAEIFCLHALNDFTYKQISAELGINAKTGRIVLRRAARKLSEHMGPLREQGGDSHEDVSVLDEAVSTLRREPIAPGPGEEVVEQVLSKLPGREAGEAATAGMRRRIAGRTKLAQRITIAAVGAAMAAAVLVGVRLFIDSSRRPGASGPQEILDTTTKQTAAEEQQKKLWDEGYAELDAELQQVRQLYEAGDIDGLIRTLMEGAPASKLLAARYLGEIGDEKALGVLQALYLLSQKSLPEGYGQGLFAEAVEKIQNRLDEEKKQQEDQVRESAGAEAILSGNVVGASGEPVGGVVVRSVLCLRQGRYFWSLEQGQDDESARTDDEGIFEMEKPGAAGTEKIRRLLIFEHDGYASGWVDADLAVAGVDLRVQLFEPTFLAGRVVDGEGNSVEGAVLSIEPNSPSYRLVRGCSIAVGTTDAEGEFLIEGIAKGASVHVNVTKDGFGPYSTRGYDGEGRAVAAGREDMVVTLGAGGMIEGRLVSQGEEYRKEGIVIRAYGPDSDRLVKTDENGKFEIPGLRDGSYTLSAYDPGTFKISEQRTDMMGSSVVTVEVDGPAPAMVDLELQRGLWVTLRIIDRDTGEPVGNHPFRISRAVSGAEQADLTLDITDEQGQFAAVLVEGDYVLRTESWQEGAHEEIRQGFGVGGGEDLNVEVAVTLRPSIHGGIVDSAGSSVSGYLWFGNQRLESDEQGRFKVAEPEGPYPKRRTCFAFDQDQKLGRALFWEKSEAADPEHDLEIVLEPVASIFGRAVDEAGAGVEDAEISIFVREESSAGTGEIAVVEAKYGEKTIDVEGWFRIEGIASGLPTLIQVGQAQVGVGGRDLGALEAGQLVDVGEIVLSPIREETESPESYQRL